MNDVKHKDEVFMVSCTLPLGDGLGRSKLARLNKVQAVLLQICDYSPVSVNAVLELAKFYLCYRPVGGRSACAPPF